MSKWIKLDQRRVRSSITLRSKFADLQPEVQPASKSLLSIEPAALRSPGPRRAVQPASSPRSRWRAGMSARRGTGAGFFLAGARRRRGESCATTCGTLYACIVSSVLSIRIQRPRVPISTCISCSKKHRMYITLNCLRSLRF